MQIIGTTYISSPHKGTIYILEVARKGSSKIHSSSMPEIGPTPDSTIPLQRVPLHIRKEARRLLLGAA